MIDSASVREVRILDRQGNVCVGLPSNLDGCRLTFDILADANGDEYRVEVWPDQDDKVNYPREIEQISAGAHVRNPQSFDVALRGTARFGYTISIHKVDAQTARRDPNEEAEILWERRYALYTP